MASAAYIYSLHVHAFAFDSWADTRGRDLLRPLRTDQKLQRDQDKERKGAKDGRREGG